MFQQIFDAVLEGGGGRRAAGAGALHGEADHAVPVAAEDDVSAVARNRRADALVQQFLDLFGDFGIGRVYVLGFQLGMRAEDGAVGEEMLHEQAEDLGFEGLPFGIRCFGDCDEIPAEEDTGDALEAEQGFGQGGEQGSVGIREVCRAVAKDLPAGEEFEGRGVGCAFGLDEHCCSSRFNGDLCGPDVG